MKYYFQKMMHGVGLFLIVTATVVGVTFLRYLFFEPEMIQSIFLRQEAEVMKELKAADPHISPAAAEFQVPRIAAANNRMLDGILTEQIP